MLKKGNWEEKQFASGTDTMSRIGHKIIIIPEGVEAKFLGNKLTVSGKRGMMEREIPSEITLELSDREIRVASKGTTRRIEALWGLYRSLIANMMTGVVTGFKKELELSGIGFKAKNDGSDLILSLGYSHPVKFPMRAGVTFEVSGDNKLIISGSDKELVGQVAAKIRELKKPEPYKGKGIKYKGEYIRRKSGKVGKVGAALGAK